MTAPETGQNEPGFNDMLDLIAQIVEDHRGQPLTEHEIAVIDAAWSGKTYKEVAEERQLNEKYLHNFVASRFFAALTEIIKAHGFKVSKVGKLSLKKFIEKEYSKLIAIEEIAILGGYPPQTSEFYGRTKELNLLSKDIRSKRCVLVSGPAGVGKSTLISKLVGKYSRRRDYQVLVWKSLIGASSASHLVSGLLRVVGVSGESGEYEDETAHLLSLMDSRPHLIVLDGAESILRSRDLLGYRTLLRRIVEQQRTSVVVLTSNEKLPDLGYWQETGHPISVMELGGLDVESAKRIFLSQGIEDQELEKLIEVHRGNPLELKLVASRIKEYFGGEISKYPQTVITHDRLRQILESHFQRETEMSGLEVEVMIYLAHQKRKVGFEQLMPHLASRYPITTSRGIEVIETLKGKYLIEWDTDGYTLQPTIRKYVLQDPARLLQNHVCPEGFRV